MPYSTPTLSLILIPSALFSLARVSVLISPLLDVICLTVLFIFGLGAMAATSHYGPESYPSVGKAMLGLGWLLDWLVSNRGHRIP